MIQRSIVITAVLAGAIAVAALVKGADRAEAACDSSAPKAELRAAMRSLDAAVRDVQAAWAGGSLYAAAKVAAADPLEIERATQRQRAAFERVQRARAACGLQVAA